MRRGPVLIQIIVPSSTCYLPQAYVVVVLATHYALAVDILYNQCTYQNAERSRKVGNKRKERRWAACRK